MIKKELTQDEFTKLLQEELLKAGEAKVGEVYTLTDQKDVSTEPERWILQNVMRTEMARLHLIKRIYDRYPKEHKRNADVIIASARAMVDSMMADTMKVSTNHDDMDKLALIIGVDKAVFARKLEIADVEALRNLSK